MGKVFPPFIYHSQFASQQVHLCWAPRARVRLWLERQEGVKSAWGHPISPQDCCRDKRTGGGGNVPPSASSPAPADTGAPPALAGSPPCRARRASSPGCRAPPELSQSQAAAGVCLCCDGVKTREEPGSTSGSWPGGAAC